MASQIMLFVLLLGMISVVTSQAVGPLYRISGYASSPSDDGSSPPIILDRPFFYFGQVYYQIYVNHNGFLTFDNPDSSTFPRMFPLHETRDFIAPFWTDLDNRQTGQVYYNQYTSGSVLQQATQDINAYFPSLNFNANWVFVATWYEVAYYSSPGTTTFQAVLISDGQCSFVLMNYGIIALTHQNVQAGYDTINSTYYFTIPGSFSSTATGSNSNFRLGSNVNVPGRWAFQTSHGSRGCTFNEECTIRDGQLGCFDAMTTCTVWGDPHYVTYDGALAHFQGTCSYIITESVNHHSNETQFQVVATNNHRGNNRVSFVSAVDIYLSNQPESAYIRIGPNQRVKINGSEVSLPTTAGTLAQVVRQGSYVMVDAVDFTVQFDGRSTLLVRMAQNRRNRVKGMCGNFNNNPADDKVLPNGTTAQHDNDFGHSWKASTSQPGCGSADDDSDDGLNDCRFVEEYSELCSVITNTSGQFSACHLHFDPWPFFSSCVYDLCLYTPANDMLCSAISAYERTCSVLGLIIPEWHSDLQCAESDPCERLDCTEYEWCGEKDGVYGCFCDEHHHQSNNENFDSSITCVSSSGTISVSRCQLFEAGFKLSALHLRDDSCKGTLQDGRLVFHFDNNDWLCGTVLRSNGTHFMYENTIRGNMDPHEGLISREKIINLNFSCVYPLAQALSMDVGINPLESNVKKRLPSGQGHYHLRMIPYEDAGFHFPLTRNRNVEMEIDQILYIEVQTEGVDEQQISTILYSCWATPFIDASYPVRWDLITSECPNPADGTVELVQNGISTVARFSFRMFTFTNFSSIYLHCQVHLCLLRHNNCSAHCYPGFHTRVTRDISFHDTAAISLGPLIPKSDKWVNTSSASGQLTSVVTLILSLLTAKTLI